MNCLGSPEIRLESLFEFGKQFARGSRRGDADTARTHIHPDERYFVVAIHRRPAVYNDPALGGVPVTRVWMGNSAVRS